MLHFEWNWLVCSILSIVFLLTNHYGYHIYHWITLFTVNFKAQCLVAQTFRCMGTLNRNT